MEKTPMTVNGEKILRLELERLKTEERPRIVQAISEAREQGDLRENAEYQYAKEQQSLIEGRISDLESSISRAEVIDIKEMSGDEIKFGGRSASCKKFLELEISVIRLSGNLEEKYEICSRTSFCLVQIIIKSNSPLISETSENIFL